MKPRPEVPDDLSEADKKTLAFWVRDRSDPEPMSGCWIWMLAVGTHGYGVLTFQRKRLLAHRASYVAFNGSISAGLNVLHRCNLKMCINPEHLYAGTQTENWRDLTLTGFTNSGELNGNARLTESAVTSIKRDIRSGEKMGKQIAAEHGVAQQTICNIKHGRRWRHVKI